LRDTTTEDFLANNGPQAVGLETDYYNRAMDLADHLNRTHLDFELAGHSLGGGLASAAAAVTGMPATTFNAAGLHPNTAARYAGRHALPVYDVSERINAYYVQGELLNDGLQRTAREMDARERNEVAGIVKDASHLVNELPQGRAWLAQLVQEGVPEVSQPVVHAFIDTLAQGDTDRLLREMPLAAGRALPLAPMTWGEGAQPVAREHVLGLREMTVLGAPLLDEARQAARGAELGARAGTLALGVPALAVRAMQTDATHFEASSEWGARMVDAATRYMEATAQGDAQAVGDGLADAREAIANVEARIDRGVGHARQAAASLDAEMLRGVGRLLPDPAQRWTQVQADALERAGEQAHRAGHVQAAQALDEGRHDAAAYRDAAQSAARATQAIATQLDERGQAALVTPGHWAARQWDAASVTVALASRQMPTLGTAVGAVAGVAVETAQDLQPSRAMRWAGAAQALAHGQQAGAEAFERHLMQATVRPSLDARIERLEQDATRALQAPPRSHGQAAPSAADATRELSFPERLDRMLAAAEAGDWKQFDQDTQALAAMPAAQQMWAHAAEMVVLEDRLTAQHQAQMQQMQQTLQQALEQQPAISRSRGRGR
jgi:hypothetical protein